MTDPTADHYGLKDTFASRRYFAKFQGIMQHMLRVAGVMEAEGKLSRDEVNILASYAVKLTYTFKALSWKYLLVGRETGRFFGSLMIDGRDSGFPVTEELMTMANDAQQAKVHLSTMPSVEVHKDRMVQTILSEQKLPTKLQFSLSQRLYYEELLRGDLFWVRNDAQIEWIGEKDGRRSYRIHWATYDSQVNLPVIYIMEVEDSGREALPRDTRRWPEVQAHLSAQALGGLKLVTIARGFDEDFDDLHPKRLRRFHLGPMYSHAYTRQNGPLRDVLAEAKAPEGDDWAMVWTEEDLLSDSVIHEKSGWFSKVERQIFALDPMGGQMPDMGATRTERSIILPQRPYQVLEEHNPPGFAGVRKFVVNNAGRVLQY
ncbi:hypothetical protein [Sulfitobacter donghicola]|uniref:Uncharacterized protein n=1 Tax=Sulfitobacter donghicola DSW-25 = KCTC 12864 = JCM 14565 TaxID=1300350 RepID=A0A073IMJ3_9RHOB|nr:hypothetical protein [Sulfitobacter donghicola]KEJ90815.1 hypothetical protein DSW25_02640 [Sulfitobacter donghicola DSW-25 = KCTC 12864 = JCM 14565]KIN68090.1 hypothetical protein Z948_1817 [Sulfitobacter donghicola DSW-25 = KCTC 12864 = JCM 14565]